MVPARVQGLGNRNGVVLHVVLAGADSYALTVQLGPVRDCAIAARRVLRAVHDWLVISDRSGNGFIDMTERFA